ncbi:hypothetical protein BAC3_02469 [uncultured bacterium]|nr:hypothetical protein BAC3_02469 [uncultured bacterium]
MFREELHEEGIVRSVHEGITIVSVVKSDECHSCGAQSICKPESGKEKTIAVVNDMGAKPGERVTISIQGGAVIQASFALYGIPLLLLVAGIWLGVTLFSGHPMQDVFGFLGGVTLMALYYVIYYQVNKSRKGARVQLPVITAIKSAG